MSTWTLIAKCDTRDSIGNTHVLAINKDAEGQLSFSLQGKSGGIGFSLSNLQLTWKYDGSFPMHVLDLRPKETLEQRVKWCLDAGVERMVPGSWKQYADITPKKEKKKKKTGDITFSCTGFVYGKHWGSGEGASKARKLTGLSEEAIIAQAEEGIKTGTLDDGMGYEKLLGAILYITRTETLMIDERPFVNTQELDPYLVGDLTDEAINFLYEC